MILLHELRYYPIQSFLAVDGIAVLHVGGIEESIQQVAKAKRLEVGVGASTAWRGVKHVIENAGQIVDGRGAGLGSVGVARSETGSSRVLEVGTSAGEDAHIGVAVWRLCCGIASGWLWLASDSTNDLVQHSEYGIRGLTILRRSGRGRAARIVGGGEGMAEAHRDATLRVGAVLEARELALFRIGGVVRSVCPGIVVMERVWRVLFLG